MVSLLAPIGPYWPGCGDAYLILSQDAGTLGNWKIWKILKEMGLDMGFWGSDPAQVGDLLEPELMGRRVLPGDLLFAGEIGKIIEKITFPTVLGWRAKFSGNLGNWLGRLGGFWP